jgi:hypothetical protein
MNELAKQLNDTIASGIDICVDAERLALSHGGDTADSAFDDALQASIRVATGVAAVATYPMTRTNYLDDVPYDDLKKNLAAFHEAFARVLRAKGLPCSEVELLEQNNCSIRLLDLAKQLSDLNVAYNEN